MASKKGIDMIGFRVERLIVIERADNTPAGNRAWLCKCDCGNHHTVLGKNLRRGSTKSCGCLRDEKSSKHFTEYNDKKFGMDRARKAKIKKENPEYPFGFIPWPPSLTL